MKRNSKDRGFGYKKSHEYPIDSSKKTDMSFDDFMPMKKHMKKCEDIIIESIKKKKDE